MNKRQRKKAAKKAAGEWMRRVSIHVDGQWVYIGAISNVDFRFTPSPNGINDYGPLFDGRYLQCVPAQM